MFYLHCHLVGDHMMYIVILLPQGAKLFYLSGLVHGYYSKVDVHNLARFIAVTKYRPLDWRCTHPYLLVDRLYCYHSYGYHNSTIVG